MNESVLPGHGKINTDRVGVVGAGFAGLSAACFLASYGFQVDVFEKHNIPGGRARQYSDKGYTFDMGPSWYWMPDVFDRFFQRFGTSTSAYYDLIRLSPAYRIVFDQNNVVDIPADENDLFLLFESIEKNSAQRLRKFLADAKYKYEVSMRDLIFKSGLHWSQYTDWRLIKSLFGLGMLQPYSSLVRKYFRDPRLIRILEFPVLFLGGTPSQIPALYSLMAYAGLSLGTWYPKGGMYKSVEGFYDLARTLGVNFNFSTEVQQIRTHQNSAQSIITSNGEHPVDYVLASADYAHVEQRLLKQEHRNYSSTYWDNRVLAPSALIFYVGVKRSVPRLLHHTLFLDASFEEHIDSIYKEPAWPTDPLFYICAPSKTDKTVAPAGHENLFILVPIATGLVDSPEMHRTCFEKIIDRLEKYAGIPIRNEIDYCQSYSIGDFSKDYHALRGNAYGLANTLWQTAIFKPKIQSRKVNNLYFAGQLTVPGPGIPATIISGEIAAGLIRDTSDREIRKTLLYGSAAV